MDEEKELYKFTTNPQYRDKIIKKIHKNQDDAYKYKIKCAEDNKSKLVRERTAEITKVEKLRWKNYANGKFAVNSTEGIITVNGFRYPFSSLVGAEINMIPGCRVISTGKAESKSKSKKHASVGGAIVGGVLFGAPGAIVGGVGLGKTNTKTKTTNSGYSTQIPTCLHLGVFVNAGGTAKEIVLISSETDQSSHKYISALNDAQNIIAQINVLAKTPMPDHFLKADEVGSVRSFDKQISNAEKNIAAAIADKPTYDIPEMYRTEEQKYMSDDEYLEFLHSMDEKRTADKEAAKKQENEEKFARKAAAQQEKSERRKARKTNCEYCAEQSSNKQTTVDVKETVNKIGKIIYNIIFWFISVFYIICGIALLSSKIILSGIIFTVVGLLVNPKIDNQINDKLTNMPKWLYIIIAIVGFFMAISALPPTI
jgi:hypothetical protein|nr:MAG TPA: hypothetical protein [Inoviridae sp.]